MRGLIATYVAVGKHLTDLAGNVLTNAKNAGGVSALAPKRPTLPGTRRRRADYKTSITKERPGHALSVRTLNTVRSGSNLYMVSKQGIPPAPHRTGQLHVDT